jgi:hypothetical protein
MKYEDMIREIKSWRKTLNDFSPVKIPDAPLDAIPGRVVQPSPIGFQRSKLQILVEEVKRRVPQADECVSLSLTQTEWSYGILFQEDGDHGHGQVA